MNNPIEISLKYNDRELFDSPLVASSYISREVLENDRERTVYYIVDKMLKQIDRALLDKLEENIPKGK